MSNDVGAPEIKADLAQAFTEFMGAFEVFRDTNDRRLGELEHKASADVVTTDKLARVEAALDSNQRRIDELVLKSHRPSLGGEVAAGPSEHKSAFEGYVRGGNEMGLRAFEQKALTGGPSDAGFTVPVETEAEVMRRLLHVSPIRAIASVRQVSGSTYKKPITSAGPVTGWVAETAVRPQTDAPTLSELSFDTMELYAMPAATSALLDDTAVDMDQWLADEIETVFAEQETAAFVAGDGIAKPKGFTDYTMVDESAWTWGNIGVVDTGANGAFGAVPGDNLIDLIYTLKAGYRQNAHFVMNRATQAAVRKLKDADGAYLWAAPAIPGARATLMNFPVVETEEMPSIAAGEPAIAFGDFRRGYLVVDRQGLRILRDPYSSKPYVLFYTTKRVGGGVQDFDAIKMLRFSA